ncbi:MAG: hypothetical protein QOG87_3199 [Actinomycetota bacterium]
MPRYLFETSPQERVLADAAAHIATLRFPELIVEHRGPLAPDVVVGLDRWICRAPSEAHVRRWSAAAGIAIAGLRRLDADLVQSSGNPPLAHSQQLGPRKGTDAQRRPAERGIMTPGETHEPHITHHS